MFSGSIEREHQKKCVDTKILRKSVGLSETKTPLSIFSLRRGKSKNTETNVIKN